METTENDQQTNQAQQTDGAPQTDEAQAHQAPQTNQREDEVAEAPPPLPQRIEADGILECQVCYDYFHNAIYQCPDGHTICQSCHSQLALPRRCPSCKCHYPNLPIRNRALERIATQAVVLELVDNPNQQPAASPGQGVKRPNAGRDAPPNNNGRRIQCHRGALVTNKLTKKF